ncbi:MAG: hypothetical protein OXK78_12335 [Caldilineaceae bacterium]|nr:hypothetical protein [Caldilineaceae bacterium]
MGKIHRELDRSRFDIQRESATVQSQQRHRAPMHGKEVIYAQYVE